MMHRADDMQGPYAGKKLHPGAARSLRRMWQVRADQQAAEARASAPVVTELDVARGVADGTLPSPTKFYNGYYTLIRLSGVGCAYRASLNEFCGRSPEVWLSPEMFARCAGLPILIGHPDGQLMSSRDFGERCVGSVVLAFERDGEPWTVSRIVDAEAARLIQENAFDSSPACLFDAGHPGVAIDIDGTPLLVEPVPAFLDHLALIDVRDHGDGSNSGVWTRAGPVGVEEDPLIDPSRNLLLSAAESNNYEIVNIANSLTPAFFEKTAIFPPSVVSHAKLSN